MSNPDDPTTKADLEPLATKADIALLKADVAERVTKAELAMTVADAVQRILDAMASMERRLRTELGADLKRHVDAAIERFNDEIRVMNDQTRAVDDRVARQERRLDEHVADNTVHKRPRRAKR